jgi:hypothetical protein
LVSLEEQIACLAFRLANIFFYGITEASVLQNEEVTIMGNIFFYEPFSFIAFVLGIKQACLSPVFYWHDFFK